MNVSRLSEDQFPPGETQHPVRRRTRIIRKRTSIRQIVWGKEKATFPKVTRVVPGARDYGALVDLDRGRCKGMGLLELSMEIPHPHAA